MKKKLFMLIAVLLVTAIVAGDAFAYFGCDTKGQRDSRHKDKIEAIKKDLNLTADQEKALKESKEAFRVQAKDLRLKLKEKRQLLQAELSKPGVTRQQVEPIVAEIKALQSDTIEQKVNGILKIKEILTPEQFAKLQAKKEAKHKPGNMKRGYKGR